MHKLSCRRPERGRNGPAAGWPRFRQEPQDSRPDRGLGGSVLTANDLLYVIRTTMPAGAVGSLADDEYVAVLSYILERNGHPTGPTTLLAESPRLKEVRVREASTEAEPVPLFIKGDAGPVSPDAGPSQAELNDAARSTRDWLYHTHDYAGSRFVELDQINTEKRRQAPGRLRLSTRRDRQLPEWADRL